MSATAECVAIRSGSWASGVATAGSFGVPDFAPGFASWVLEYVQPLHDWFGDLAGDPGQVEQVAASWEGVETTLTRVANELERVETQLQPLDGRTIRTLRLRYEDLNPTARDAAEWSAAVAAAARLALSVVNAVRSFIYDFLDQLARLVRALFGFTLNPFEKVEQLRQLADAAWGLIRAGQRLINRMFDAFERLIELMSRLGPVIEETLVTLREVIANMLPIYGSVIAGPVGMIFGGVARDAMMDLGSVSRYDIDELQQRYASATGDEKVALKKKIDAWLDSERNPLDSLSDLVAMNGATDGMGGADATAIDIKLVRAPDGSEHWIVSLPSTQEWLDMYGSGAMNDGKNNPALLLDNPLLKTQYERAVLQAMREAGMTPGDPVVFTGFSQGGIMAANLASDPNLPYRPIGVVTNGSPIDTFQVPPGVPVVSFQHASDPVPKLDLGGLPGTPSNVERVVLPNPHGSILPSDTHNNDNYVNSIEQYAPEIDKKYAWMGGEVIDHQVFSTTQR